VGCMAFSLGKWRGFSVVVIWIGVGRGRGIDPPDMGFCFYEICIGILANYGKNVGQCHYIWQQGALYLAKRAKWGEVFSLSLATDRLIDNESVNYLSDKLEEQDWQDRYYLGEH